MVRAVDDPYSCRVHLALPVLAGALVLTALGTSVAAASPDPTPERCETAWFEYQYSQIAPGFPTTMSTAARDQAMEECASLNMMPTQARKLELTQEALNVVAQIVERKVRKVSAQRDIQTCRAAEMVLKPVGAFGKPLGPRDNVMGFAPDSFLPILKYNWWSGPFRLQMIGGCVGRPEMSLWFFVDPYPPNADRPGRFPSPASVKKNPWNRTPVEGRMSTCVTWGPGLKNDKAGGRGLIFSFDWSQAPQGQIVCYDFATRPGGINRYPFTEVPSLP